MATVKEIDYQSGDATLLNNLILLAKNWYGSQHAKPEGVLALVREWTGTMATGYMDVVNIVMGPVLQLGASNPQRHTRFVLNMVLPNWLDHKDSEAKRALSAILSHLAVGLPVKEIWGDEGRPEIDPKIQAVLDSGKWLDPPVQPVNELHAYASAPAPHDDRRPYAYLAVDLWYNVGHTDKRVRVYLMRQEQSTLGELVKHGDFAHALLTFNDVEGETTVYCSIVVSLPPSWPKAHVNYDFRQDIVNAINRHWVQLAEEKQLEERVLPAPHVSISGSLTTGNFES